MNISYDYEKMIQELKEELLDGVLSQEDNIFVLHEEKTFNVSNKKLITENYSSFSPLSIPKYEYPKIIAFINV